MLLAYQTFLGFSVLLGVKPIGVFVAFVLALVQGNSGSRTRGPPEQRLQEIQLHSHQGGRIIAVK